MSEQDKKFFVIEKEKFLGSKITEYIAGSMYDLTTAVKKVVGT